MEGSFGPAPTTFGKIRVVFQAEEKNVRVRWESHWRAGEPRIEVRLPGFSPAEASPGETEITIRRMHHATA
jgi:hypothetical protein